MKFFNDFFIKDNDKKKLTSYLKKYYIEKYKNNKEFKKSIFK